MRPANSVGKFGRRLYADAMSSVLNVRCAQGTWADSRISMAYMAFAAADAESGIEVKMVSVHQQNTLRPKDLPLSIANKFPDACTRAYRCIGSQVPLLCLASNWGCKP